MTDGKPAACALCFALARIHDVGDVADEDVSDAYAVGFADGAQAVLKGMRRELCASHESELTEALAERNIRMGATPSAAQTKTRQ